LRDATRFLDRSLAAGANNLSAWNGHLLQVHHRNDDQAVFVRWAFHCSVRKTRLFISRHFSGESAVRSYLQDLSLLHHGFAMEVTLPSESGIVNCLYDRSLRTISTHVRGDFHRRKCILALPMKGKRDFLKEFDIFSKVDKSAVPSSTAGGIFSFIVISIVLFLFVQEFISYRASEFNEYVSVDKSGNGVMELALDISFPHLPCSGIPTFRCAFTSHV
jgi:hypothetical protein